MENIKFSVLMSIYEKEKPEFFKEAMDSIFNQSLIPTEVILVEDGVLNDKLDAIILEYEKKFSNLHVIKFKTNRGLGEALNDGLKSCHYDYVFRMDTDDICVNNRFEKQIKYMIEHPEVDVLGCNIYEFKNNINEKMRIKKMPTGQSIENYIKKRNPLNHMTVCFKKKSVLECGSYKTMPYLEDYYLWIRMFVENKRLENINEELVYARIGNEFEKRRGNKKQLAGWKKIQDYMLKNNVIDKKEYYKNIVKMYLLIYCPNIVRKIVYELCLRRYGEK